MYLIEGRKRKNRFFLLIPRKRLFSPQEKKIKKFHESCELFAKSGNVLVEGHGSKTSPPTGGGQKEGDAYDGIK